MTEAAAYVLDSFALLVYLQDEPAASRIKKLMDQAGKMNLGVMIFDLFLLENSL
ncbi:MAG TPA: hypothetical protein VGK56_00740 [Anaerolineales bacterium]